MSLFCFRELPDLQKWRGGGGYPPIPKHFLWGVQEVDFPKVENVKQNNIYLSVGEKRFRWTTNILGSLYSE